MSDGHKNFIFNNLVARGRLVMYAFAVILVIRKTL